MQLVLVALVAQVRRAASALVATDALGNSMYIRRSALAHLEYARIRRASIVIILVNLFAAYE